MSHTPEPWIQDKRQPQIIFPSGPSFDSIASVQVSNCENWEENARRIVACVNACAGIPNEQLECDNIEFVRIFNERNALKQQSDELIAALKRIKSNLMHHRRFGTDTFQAWKNAAVRAEGDAEEAIIANAKGGAV